MNSELIDTHCHIHDAAFSDKFANKSPDLMIKEAHEAGVEKLICVGTDLSSSEQAVEFCASRENCFSSVALHPHEVATLSDTEIEQAMTRLRAIVVSKPPSLKAIGECGLDYFYHSDTETHERQQKLLRAHLDIAVKFDLPLIFHIRDAQNSDGSAASNAFEEFFEIFDSYKKLRGVVHSFSATKKELAGVLERDLYVGLNGIMTFTKLPKQLEAAKAVPLEKIVVETDAPFLTPAPLRGKMCEPKHVVFTAEFLSDLRGENPQQFAKQTTLNAQRLFGL